MTAYRTNPRDGAPRSSDLETAAIHDLLARIKRLRRRVALPTLILTSIAAWLGAAAHALGYWSVVGSLPDESYYVSTGTMLGAGILCGVPIAIPGVVLYITLRASLRYAWRKEYWRKRVCDEWLERDEWLARTSRRFS